MEKGRKKRVIFHSKKKKKKKCGANGTRFEVFIRIPIARIEVLEGEVRES